MIIHVDTIKDWTTKRIEYGEWVFARPENYKYDTLLSRIKQSLGVLIGKYDALDWNKRY